MTNCVRRGCFHEDRLHDSGTCSVCGCPQLIFDRGTHSVYYDTVTGFGPSSEYPCVPEYLAVGQSPTFLNRNRQEIITPTRVHGIPNEVTLATESWICINIDGYAELVHRDDEPRWRVEQAKKRWTP